VTSRNGETLAGLGRVEYRGCDPTADLGQRQAQSWCKLVRAVRRLQTRRNSHEQGIVQHIPEPRERMAEPLREKKTSRRPGDVTLVMQDLKNPQQIDVSLMNRLNDDTELYALA
jgi:hypothetical protein